MKKIFLLVALIATISAKTSFAQNSQSQSLLSSYYDIKNALVNSDAATASAKADDFLKAVNALPVTSLAAAEKDAFLNSKVKLTANAKRISSAKDIEAQRAVFGDFSADFFKLAKSVKLTDAVVYYDYCPMKKEYWLSADAGIKNPYFGKQMLTCGKTTETLNK